VSFNRARRAICCVISFDPIDGPADAPAGEDGEDEDCEFLEEFDMHYPFFRRLKLSQSAPILKAKSSLPHGVNSGFTRKYSTRLLMQKEVRLLRAQFKHRLLLIMSPAQKSQIRNFRFPAHS
jgi:hypothetical protein